MSFVIREREEHTERIELGITMLNEIKQGHKNRYHMLFLAWEISCVHVCTRACVRVSSYT